MTLTLDLTPEEEARLRRKAARLGLDEVGYLRLLINEETPGEEDLPKTPAEAIAFWNGKVYSAFSPRARTARNWPGSYVRKPKHGNGELHAAGFRRSHRPDP